MGVAKDEVCLAMLFDNTIVAVGAASGRSVGSLRFNVRGGAVCVQGSFFVVAFLLLGICVITLRHKKSMEPFESHTLAAICRIYIYTYIYIYI